SNSPTIRSRSPCGIVRSMRAPSISAFNSSCLKNLSSRPAAGLPIATRMAAAFCALLRLRGWVIGLYPWKSGKSARRLAGGDDLGELDAEARWIVVEHGDLAAGDLLAVDDDIDRLADPPVERNRGAFL